MTPPKATLESALAQAQSEIPAVKLDSMGHYNHKFASLGAVIETAKPILAKHGLSIVQFPTSVMGNEILTDRIGVRTVLLHSAGQAMEETITIPLPDGQNAAQEAGKIITYLRRYAYAAVLGMYAEEDNDANLPQTPAKPAQDKPSAKKQAPANGDRPLAPDKLKAFMGKKSANYAAAGREATDKQIKFLPIVLSKLFKDDDERHTATDYLFGVTSTALLKTTEVLAMLDWIDAEKIDGNYIPSEYAIKEAQSVLTAALKDEGQMELGA